MQDTEMRRNGVSGFLIMQCCACRKIKIFSTKYALTRFECACGQRTKIEDVAPAYVNCECGARRKYRTNVTDLQFTARCVECGSPVEMELGKNGRVYETMGSGYEARKNRRH